MQTAIYRTGLMEVGNHNEEVLEQWFPFDERRPVGHASRSHSLYAAPDLTGAHRWFSFLYGARQFAFNEIIVESNNVMVYNVDDYDQVGEHYGNPTSAHLDAIDAYWNSGMTLTEWIHRVGVDEDGRWEILLPEKQVISSRTLSYDDMEELYIANGMDDDRLEFVFDVFGPKKAYDFALG